MTVTIRRQGSDELVDLTRRSRDLTDQVPDGRDQALPQDRLIIA